MSRFSGWTAEAVAKINGDKIEKRKQPKSNKYHAIKTEYSGKKYDSKFEAEFAQKLDIMKTFGKIKDWKRQIAFDLKVDGKKICRYVVDFVVFHLDGKEEYIEIKGVETAAWKIKRNLFLQLHKNIRYRVIKQNDKA